MKILPEKRSLILSLLFLSFSASGQFEAIKIGFAAGYSAPIGQFRNNDPTDMLVLVQDAGGSRYVFNGFRKTDNGFALPGYAIRASVGYAISKHISIELTYQSTRHDVDTHPASNFFNDRFSNAATPSINRFEQRAYQNRNLLVGIRYGFFIFGWQLSLGAKSGWGVLDFPEYTWKITTFNQDPPFEFTGVDQTAKPASRAFSFGGDIRIEHRLYKRLFCGLSMEYLNATFPYSTTIKFPGIDATTHADLVPYQVLNFMGFVGVRFLKN